MSGNPLDTLGNPEHEQKDEEEEREGEEWNGKRGEGRVGEWRGGGDGTPPDPMGAQEIELGSACCITPLGPHGRRELVTLVRLAAPRGGKI